MTLARSAAILCCCIILPASLGGLWAQENDLSSQLSKEQMFVLDSLASDTTDGTLTIPNVFTPNDDAVNDYFEVETDGVKVYDFMVFTRTGTRVYHSNSPRIFWDGRTLGGQELSEGIYYYVIEATGEGENYETAGIIYLFR